MSTKKRPLVGQHEPGNLRIILLGMYLEFIYSVLIKIYILNADLTYLNVCISVSIVKRTRLVILAAPYLLRFPLNSSCFGLHSQYLLRLYRAPSIQTHMDRAAITAVCTMILAIKHHHFRPGPGPQLRHTHRTFAGTACYLIARASVHIEEQTSTDPVRRKGGSFKKCQLHLSMCRYCRC